MSKSDGRQKFVELAEKRVSRALKDIHLIGNLSNKSNYSYASEDAQKIYKALSQSVEVMKGRFDSQLKRNKKAFKL